MIVFPSANFVHARMQAMFPFLIAAGWSYRGFRRVIDGDLRALNLRFEKKIKGRLAYANVEVAVVVFQAPDFDLKEWIVKELAKVEEAMVNRHLSEFAGAA